MTKDWKLDDFGYELPDELIAQNPKEQRSKSRVLQVKLENVSRKPNDVNFNEFYFSDLASKLKKNDLLIFNNSKVVPARLRCTKKTGGNIEVLVTDNIQTNHTTNRHANALVKPGRNNLIGENIKIVGSNEYVKILNRNPNRPEQFMIQFSKSIKDTLNKYGEMPLPPYIKRKEAKSDKNRYQNVYADTPGSIAAPTAGLHFDNQLFEKLRLKGVNFGFVTLHVGIGTFMPIRSHLINDHNMHEEHCEISDNCAEAINLALRENHRIIAVGTTSLRLLESLVLRTINVQATNRKPLSIESQSWNTDLFIKPGFQFKIIDGLITNFHLPKSTLMILISAFLGHKICMRTYQEAIQRNFRFFSYGDAMIAIKPQHVSFHRNFDAS
ncbi:MAG: tRNA preQ1(34) S-adenosylmethionine ribosyltransferase-isomerase QueA [Betaproteobacteria bacterium TMED41]|nr:MAG: tRNA preQ1(34) S-adenosylmethionine ribosyltransferase-isomerase QueA [Betaproteobacteria bacterium TMED41]